MGLFGGDSKSSQTTNVRNDTTQIAGGDALGSQIATGGSQVTVNNSGGDNAFGFGQGVADSAFGIIGKAFDSIGVISGQTKDIERQALSGESAAIADKRNKSLLIGGGVLIALLIFGKKLL